jgi:hypothetical protein
MIFRQPAEVRVISEPNNKKFNAAVNDAINDGFTVETERFTDSIQNPFSKNNWTIVMVRFEPLKESTPKKKKARKESDWSIKYGNDDGQN